MRIREARTTSARLVRRADLALLAGLAISLWAFFVPPGFAPPYVDYDTATIGTFTNNLTYRGQFDFGFRDSLDFQERYRGFWAAHFLPVATVLAAMQSLLDIAPENVGDLLHAVTLLLGMAGCACAGALAMRRPGTDWRDALFVGGFTAAAPPFLLYLRSDFVHLLSFALFWSCLLFLRRFLDSPRLADGIALALLGALFVLQPAPSLPALGLAGIGLVVGAVRQHGLGAVLHRRTALAVVLALALVRVIPMGAAWACGADPADVRARAARFVALRSQRAFAPAYRDGALLPDKLAKLTNQHLWLQRDRLGDSSRSDAIWTLPAPDLPWAAAMLVAIGGWIVLLRRRRDETSHTFALVLTGVLAVMLAVSFPEGRYLLPIVPCYAWGALAALRMAVPCAARRAWWSGLALAAMGISSFVAVGGDYQRSMLDAGRNIAGLREAVTLIRTRCGRECAPDRPLLLGHAVAGFQEKLYVDMLTNGQYRPLGPEDPARRAGADAPRFALVDADSPQAAARWSDRGFRPLGEVTDAPSSRRFLVLEKR